MKVVSILGATSIIYMYLALVSTGSIETGDSYQHYQISRYSIAHPRLFLDLWGKPLFTLLSAPFSQFGFIGMKVFNIFAALGAAYVTYLVAKRLGKPNPYMAIIFMLFSVLYIETVLSGLTEPLFSLFLISAIYLHVTGRTGWAATVCSFSPLVRNEGYILIFLYATLLVLKSKYSNLGYLLIGTVFFYILGHALNGQSALLPMSKAYMDMIFSEYYPNTPHMSLTHYVADMPASLGAITTLLVLAGLWGFFLEALKAIPRRPAFLDEGVMVHSSAAVIVGFHSFIAWAGIFGSIGSRRYIIIGLPCMALIALDGFNRAMDALPGRKNTRAIFTAITVLLVITCAFAQGRLPIRYSQEQIMFNKVYGWYMSSNETGGKLYDRNPYLDYLLDIDPYDENVHENIALIYSRNIMQGSIVVWDSHHAKLDARVPLEMINKTQDYRLIQRIDIGENVRTMIGDKYEVYVFKRVT